MNRGTFLSLNFCCIRYSIQYLANHTSVQSGQVGDYARRMIDPGKGRRKFALSSMQNLC